MKNWLGNLVQAEISIEDTVLDLGCGIMQAFDELYCKSILGADIWPDYLRKISRLCPTVIVDLNERIPFVSESYDVVICLDVLEHLKIETALLLLDEMKLVCRKKVIVYTPRIFDKNAQPKEGAWDMGECEFQSHVSLIRKNDLRAKGYQAIRKDVGWYAVYHK